MVTNQRSYQAHQYGSCGKRSRGGCKRRSWAESDGVIKPFVCLRKIVKYSAYEITNSFCIISKMKNMNEKKDMVFDRPL